MKIIYELAIRFLGLFFIIAYFVNSQAKKWIVGRRNWRQLNSKCPKNSIWFHCASLGEFDQALPLMRELKKRNQEEKIIVSFFSPSGMEHYSKRNHPVDFAIYLPLDTKKNAIDFIHLIEPKMAIFVKYEFWPNILNCCVSKKIPVIYISAVFRNSQIFFKWYGRFFLEVLKKIDLFFLQNQESFEVLSQFGIKQAIVSGDTRYDSVLESKRQSKENEILKKFVENSKVLIVGSSWQQEEQLIASYLSKNTSIKIILAPHKIDESNILRIVRLFGSSSIQYTSFQNYSSQRVLILDTMGHLTDAYKYADIAFIGGGFSGKLHNILEPAAYGLPILFGPNYHKFPEAEMFISNGIAFSIKNKMDLESRLKDLINKPRTKSEILKTIESNAGATSIMIGELQRKKIII